MLLKYTFAFPIIFAIDVNEFTSWRDVVNLILNKHRLLIIDNIEYILFDNKIIKINDDFIDINENNVKTLTIVLKSNTFNISFFNELTMKYNTLYMNQNYMIQQILNILYNTLLTEDEESSDGSVPVRKLTMTEIDKFKTLEYKDLTYKYGEKYDTCPISQIKMDENTTILQLSCDHYFIKDYIVSWLKDYSATCPTCRLNF